MSLHPTGETPAFSPPWEVESRAQKIWRAVLEWRQWWILLGIAATSWWLWHEAHVTAHFPAYVQRQVYVATAPATGTLAKLSVRKGQQVKRGQLLAAMDDKNLALSLQIAQLEKKKQERLLVSQALQFQISHIGLQARLQAFVNEAQSSWLSGRTRLLSSKAELQALNKELRYLKNVRQSRFGRSNTLGSLQARQKSLKALVQAMPRLLRMYRHKRNQTRSLARKFRPLSGKQAKEQMDKLLRPLQIQWAIQTMRIKQLELQRSRTKLKAPVSGTIDEILQRPGSRLTLGTPIVRMVRENRRTIEGYLQEGLARQLQSGSPVRVYLSYPKQAKGLWSRLQKPKALCGKVTALGALGPLPLRFRRTPQRPRWVRPIIVRLDAPHPLLAGEQVKILLGRCTP